MLPIAFDRYPMTNRTDLILGYATNAGATAIEPFVATARRWHGENCRLSLFVTPGGKEAAGLQALAEAHHVDLLPATSQWSGDRSRASKLAGRAALAWWRWWDRGGGARHDISRQIALAAWLHPHYSRWFDYSRYLRLFPSIDRVFVSDVTDVIFQGNIFEQLETRGLTMPALPLVYDGSNVDSVWMQSALGAARLAELRGKPVICIGTVGGDAASVATLCEKMWNTFEATPYGGVEQAYFNDMYYRGEFDPASIRTNDDPFVLTIPSEAECPNLAMSAQGFRHGARAPAVVHMYNRLSARWKPDVDAIVRGQSLAASPSGESVASTA